MMRGWMTGAVVAAALAGSVALAAAPPASAPRPVEVMVLGSFHMDNPGQDLHNARVDPVTTPAKQAQLASAVAGLARFRPTAVAVEREAADQDSLLDQKWPAFTPADLLRNADERVQLGYRLARNAGVARVYAVDADGDFPFDKVEAWAKANGQGAALDGFGERIERWTKRLEQDQRRLTVAQLLATINDPAAHADEVGQGASYYQLLRMGRGRDLPGAELNAAWYARNARIWAHVMQVARPGDRVVLIFGAGHGYWLRHFAETTDGFRLVDPRPYLKGR